MNYLIETFGVLSITCAGILLAVVSARFSKYYWLAVYIIALALIFLVNIPMGTFGVEFSGSLRFLTTGRREFIILSFAAPVMFAALLPRLKGKGVKILLAFFIAVAVLSFTVIPFLVPFFIRNEMANLKTRFNRDICLQSAGFTDGPAAAVTALRRIGIHAEEGIIAIDSYSTPFWGTDEDLLARAVNKRYGRDGALCRMRSFKSVDELADYCPTIAVVRFSSFVDNYITVLDVRGNFLIIGDGLEGMVKISFEDFEKIWQFRGIVVSNAGKIIFI